jgi:hypothetical protein|tara:strand:- start:296 stop:472 length:177 start_codon:yes stop_codon:yes gene_type:complete
MAFNFINRYIDDYVTLDNTSKIILLNREKEILNLIANATNSIKFAELLFIAKQWLILI